MSIKFYFMNWVPLLKLNVLYVGIPSFNWADIDIKNEMWATEMIGVNKNRIKSNNLTSQLLNLFS